MAIVNGDPVEAEHVLVRQPSQAGTEPISFVAQTNKTVSVVFPDATRFSVPPSIMVQVLGGAGSLVGWKALVTARTATGFTVRIDLAASTTVDFNFMWQAVEEN